MSVETRVSRASLEDGVRHVARFLGLYMVQIVGFVLAITLVGTHVHRDPSWWFPTYYQEIIAAGVLGCWLPALVLTIAWRSSEVSHAR